MHSLISTRLPVGCSITTPIPAGPGLPREPPSTYAIMSTTARSRRVRLSPAHKGCFGMPTSREVSLDIHRQPRTGQWWRPTAGGRDAGSEQVCPIFPQLHKFRALTLPTQEDNLLAVDGRKGWPPE